jgi:hypothetical protein
MPRDYRGMPRDMPPRGIRFLPWAEFQEVIPPLYLRNVASSTLTKLAKGNKILTLAWPREGGISHVRGA